METSSEGCQDDDLSYENVSKVSELEDVILYGDTSTLSSINSLEAYFYLQIKKKRNSTLFFNIQTQMY